MNFNVGRVLTRFALLLVLLVAAGGGWYAKGLSQEAKPSGHSKEEEHDHEHQHKHDDGNTLDLSPQALRNIGLQTVAATLGPFERTITVPAMVVQQPGRTSTRVVAPLTGVITRVYALAGEVLPPGQPLFDVRLTHEDLVQAQVDFLKTLEERDVVQREVTRLKPLFEKGVIPQKTFLEREYEHDKLNALHKAQRQALLLHGLSESQIEEIINSRRLLATLTVVVPKSEANRQPGAVLLQTSATAPTPVPEVGRLIEELKVQQGQLVTAGDPLCILADLSNLYIEGRGFEQDSSRILEAVRNGWKVTAILDTPGQQETRLEGLSILFVADKVDAESRTFPFYVHLKNEILRDTTIDGHRFLNWRFRPGQRVQLRVPVQKWEKRLVVPASAVVQDGVEMYVFVKRDAKFKRRAVHVEYRDRTSAVIQTDGALFPGEVIAATGAAQLQMALKNKAAGPIDPHAGHNH